MGVPKFYRWLSERYPSLSVCVERNKIPDFDCLYLDMNGIIHVCSHPNDNDVNFKVSESEVFDNILNYIDFLFKMIKPKELFYLAVDGVAPRAKMNQQRARRYKSALERKNRENSAKLRNEMNENDKQFDSNAITPGTEFMKRLQVRLEKFVQDNMRSDSQWKSVNVILSGHETPGEGEHKIQEYIRYRRSQPDYNPNTKHCLYGLDADLIILGLASHEPYFALLREEVLFNRKKESRSNTGEETKFHLLYISLLRDYIDFEFSTLKSHLQNEYDLERVIDDWIVLTFFVGNDFIPHVPNLHIRSMALPLLWEKYIETRPKMKSYINDNGKLNLENLKIFIQTMCEFDDKVLKEEYDDMKWMMGKTGKKMGDALDNLGLAKKINNDNEIDLVSFFDDKMTIEEPLENTETSKGVVITNGEAMEDIEAICDADDEEVNTTINMQIIAHKRNYYFSKMGLTMSDDMLAQQAYEYIRAMQWISYYYFCGVQSWDWFYPGHYAPFISDLLHLNEDIINDGIKFEMNKPFLPFQQLLGVLPPDSSDLLPGCLQFLMTSDESSIIDFYPKTFKTDLNGKKAEWEALVLIPFINEKRLIDAMEPLIPQMTEEEKTRNIHNSCHVYSFSTELNCSKYDPFYFRLKLSDLKYHLLDNVRLDVLCQGFPTLSTGIRIAWSLEKWEVKLFESMSRNLCLLLRVEDETQTNIKQLANNYLNKPVLVNWPNVLEVMVVALVHDGIRYSRSTGGTSTTGDIVEEVVDNMQEYNYFVEAEQKRLSFRKGIVINPKNKVVIEALQNEGRRYVIDGLHKAGISLRSEMVWGSTRSKFLQQLSILKSNVRPISNVSARNSDVCIKLNQLLQENDTVFCIDKMHYGVAAQVMKINNNNGKIKVKFLHYPEPDFTGIDQKVIEYEYLTLNDLIKYIPKINKTVLARITGYLPIKITNNQNEGGGSAELGTTVQNNSGRKNAGNSNSMFNIGLNLKCNKGNGHLPRWVMRAYINENNKVIYPDCNGGSNETNLPGTVWVYTIEVAKLLDEYRSQFPEVFEFLEREDYEKLNMHDLFDCHDDENLFQQRCENLKKYISSLPYHSEPHLSHQHRLVCSNVVTKIESILTTVDYSSTLSELDSQQKQEEITEVQFSDLWCPHSSLATTKPDMQAQFQLLDRVVCVVPPVNNSGSTNFLIPVPCGLRGTVIGIEPPQHGDSEARLEVLFDTSFPGAISIRGSAQQCYRMPAHFLINYTFGRLRKYNRQLQSTSDKSHRSILTEKQGSTTVNRKSQTVDSKIKTVDVASSSDLNYSNIATSMPPTPPKEFLKKEAEVKNNAVKDGDGGKMINRSGSKRNNFIAHCDQVYKNTFVLTANSCPVHYEPFFQWCNMYGIGDGRLDIYNPIQDGPVTLRFSSYWINISEFTEIDINRAMESLYKRILDSIKASIQYQPYMYPTYVSNNRNSFPFEYGMQPHFYGNPVNVNYQYKQIQKPVPVKDNKVVDRSRRKSAGERPAMVPISAKISLSGRQQQNVKANEDRKEEGIISNTAASLSQTTTAASIVSETTAKVKEGTVKSGSFGKKKKFTRAPKSNIGVNFQKNE